MAHISDNTGSQGPSTPLLSTSSSPTCSNNQLSQLEVPEESSLLSSSILNTMANTDLNISDVINPLRSTLYILMLTIIVGGLQLAWCAEFSEGTPFLTNLGVSKHMLALVWIAGPLSGTFGQPIVGIFSDACTYKHGRRKPFIIGGCIATSCSLFYLSYSIDIVGFFVDKNKSHDEIKALTIPFAVFGVYILDFSISAIQATSRAYIVDNVPTSQQQVANAWAARLNGTFNIIGYVLAAADLPQLFPFLGTSQFKVLASSASIVMTATVILSFYFIKERNPNTDIAILHERKQKAIRMRKMGLKKATGWRAIIAVIKETLYSITRLPPQVNLVCKIQFFAWVGYFPMLFYTTTYVGDLYKKEYMASRPIDSPPLTPEENDIFNDNATRRGALALVVHAITSLTVDVLLPLVIKPTHDNVIEESGVTEVKKSKLTLEWLTVGKTWTITHAIFILCMVSTFWIDNSAKAIWMFGFLGIPWGVALWAPFVLISEDISRIKEMKGKSVVDHTNSNLHDHPNESDSNHFRRKKFELYECEPGVILGIHNVFVSFPQVISSLFSSFLFKLFENSSKSDDSMGWVFRMGGMFAIVAFFMSFKLKSTEELYKIDNTYIDEDGEDVENRLLD